MEDKIEKLKKELDSLIGDGKFLYLAMLDNSKKLPKDFKKDLEDKKLKFPDFHSEYDTWYSEALRVIKQIIPERLIDFIKQYKDEKRKDVDFLTYSISDYLIGLKTSRGLDVIVDTSAATPKMQNQIAILKSAKKRFKSSLFDIKEILQADLFNSDLDSAKELCKKGFTRGAGAISGVVLEKHLGHICTQHKLTIRKKTPTISDFNQILKDNDVIDIPKWRFIQHLGDLRNLCDHKKDREPTKEDILELIEVVDKIIKTVY